MLFQKALMELENANSAEEILVAAVHYVNSRQEQEVAEGNILKAGQPSSAIITELQGLLIKKTSSDPSLLKSLLSVHLRELMAVLQQASPSTSDLDTSLHHLLNQLTALTLKPSVLDHPRNTASDSKLSQRGSPKGDHNEDGKLEEQFSEVIQHQIRKIRKQFEHTTDFDDVSANKDRDSLQTKDLDRKDEL